MNANPRGGPDPATSPLVDLTTIVLREFGFVGVGEAKPDCGTGADSRHKMASFADR